MIQYIGDFLDKLTSIDRNAQLTFTTSSGEHTNYDVVTDGVVNVEIQLGESEAEAELAKLEAEVGELERAIKKAQVQLNVVNDELLDQDSKAALAEAIELLGGK